MAEGTSSSLVNESGKNISGVVAKRPYTKRQKRPIDELGHSSKTVIAKKTRSNSKDCFSVMNLDTLFYLCNFLDPIDLLHLSRTSKAFRQYLMSKSSAPIWKAALLRLPEVPECPPELSEPQHASFLFEHHCHGCGGSADKVFWRFRARYCRSCAKLNTMDRWQLPEMISKLISGFPCLPTEGGKGSKKLYHCPDVDAFKDKVSDMLLPDINKHMEECHQLTLAIEKHAELCEQWSESFNRRPEYSEAEMQGWTRAWMIKRGWEPEVNHFDFKALTQYVGLQRIPSIDLGDMRFRNKRLDETMVPWRAVRIEETVYTPRRRILIAAYKKYLRDSVGTGDGYDLMPHVADVSAFQPFNDIIKSPPDVVVDTLSFTTAFAQLPTLVSEWRQKIDKQLSELCERSRLNSAIYAAPSNDQSALLARLRLASTVFTPSCPPSQGRMRDMLFYPDMLAYHDFVEPRRLCPPSAESSADQTLGGRPWYLDAQHRGPIVKIYEKAADIIRTCGKDPGTATADDMDIADPWLRCDECFSSKGEYLAMSWRKAIYHAIRSHFFEPHFTLLSYEDDFSVRTLMRTKEAINEDQVRHICKLCRRSVGDAMQKSELISHLQVEHQIPEAAIKREVHYMPDPNTAPTMISPVMFKLQLEEHVKDLQDVLPSLSSTFMLSAPGGPVVPPSNFMFQTPSPQFYFPSLTPGISGTPWMHQPPMPLPTAPGPSGSSMPLAIPWDLISPATNSSVASSSYNAIDTDDAGPAHPVAQAPDSNQHDQPESDQV